MLALNSPLSLCLRKLPFRLSLGSGRYRSLFFNDLVAHARKVDESRCFNPSLETLFTAKLCLFTFALIMMHAFNLNSSRRVRPEFPARQPAWDGDEDESISNSC